MIDAIPIKACKRQRVDVPPIDPLLADVEMVTSVADRNVDAVVYVARLADTPGKYDATRARALGVTPGPHCARLVAGESVTLADGRIIHPSDVVGAARPGASFVIVDCPTLHHIDTLPPAFPDITVVVHVTPEHVARSDAYAAWRKSTFDGNVTQLMCSEGAHHDARTFRDSAAQQVAMQHVCGELFADYVTTPVPDDVTPPLTRFIFPPQKKAGLDLSRFPPPIDVSNVRQRCG
jgi:hypothetical protein